MKGIAPMAGRVILGLLLLVSFCLDLANTAQGGAIDLRNRVTGIRLLEHGIDPYHYKWSRSEPEIYCDPYNNPLLPVSKTTATPALLLLHLPLAPLPYRLAQLLWFLGQWALLLGAMWLWLGRCTMPWQRWLVAAFTTGFTYTAAWRLHAERGQAYVLLAFLFAWWLAMTLDPKRGNGWAAGCLAGLLIALRPPFLLLAPFLALHRRGQLPGAAAGLILGVVLPLFLNSQVWPDYFSAMRDHASIYRADFAPHYQQDYPPRIEGIATDTLGHYAVIPYADFSIYALPRRLGLDLSGPDQALFPDWLPLLAVAVAFGLWLGWSRQRRMEELLAGLAAWFFLADLCLPAYRNSYNDVLILNVVALGLVALARIPWAVWPCLLALPLGWGVYVVAPTEAWIINLPSFFFALGAILFLFFGGRPAGFHRSAS